MFTLQVNEECLVVLGCPVIAECQLAHVVNSKVAHDGLIGQLIQVGIDVPEVLVVYGTRVQIHQVLVILHVVVVEVFTQLILQLCEEINQLRSLEVVIVDKVVRTLEQVVGGPGSVVQVQRQYLVTSRGRHEDDRRLSGNGTGDCFLLSNARL